MSLSTYALATVDELKAFMGNVAGSGVDPNFEIALNAASLNAVLPKLGGQS